MNKQEIAKQEAFEDWFNYLLETKRLVYCTQTLKDLLQETYETAWDLSEETTAIACLDNLYL